MSSPHHRSRVPQALGFIQSSPGRRSLPPWRGLLASLVLATVLTTPALAKKKQQLVLAPPPVEAISTGDVTGAFDTAYAPDGRLWIAYQSVAEVDDAAVTTVWLRTRDVTGWRTPVPLPIEAPTELTLEIYLDSPVIAYRNGDGAHLLRPDDDGEWSITRLAEAVEQPSDVTLTLHTRSLHALLSCIPTTSEPAAAAELAHRQEPRTDDRALRRLVWKGSDLQPAVDYPLRGLDGELLGITPTRGDGDDVVFGHESDVMVLRRGDERGTSRARQLAYARLGKRFLPTSLLTSSSDPVRLATTALLTGPAILWTRREKQRYRLYLLAREGNRFMGPTSLLDHEVAPTAIGIASRKSGLLVAIIHESALLFRRQTGGFWDEWHRPPGAERALGPEPLELRLFVDSLGMARVVLRERSFNYHQLVEWVDPPRTITAE